MDFHDRVFGRESDEIDQGQGIVALNPAPAGEQGATIMLGKTVAAAAGALLGLGVMAAPGQASVKPDPESLGRYYIDCHNGGSISASYDPPLGATSKTINISAKGSIDNCRGWDGHKRITSATVELSGSGSGSCLLFNGKGTMRVRWNTGAVSELDWKGTAGSGPVIFSAMVSSGLFAGHYAAMQGVSTKQGLADIIECGMGTVGVGGYASGSFDIKWAFIYGPTQKTIAGPDERQGA